MEVTNPSFLDLVRTPRMRRNTLILMYAWWVIISTACYVGGTLSRIILCWLLGSSQSFAVICLPLSAILSLVLRFTSALIYQGLVMRLGIVGGNLYLDFFISGAVELPAALLILITIDRIGRRLPFAISNIVAGIACLITAFLPEGNFQSFPTLGYLGQWLFSLTPLKEGHVDKSKRSPVMQAEPRTMKQHNLFACRLSCDTSQLIFNEQWTTDGCNLGKCI